MNLEYQVCSLELAKRLKELEVKQESLFYYVNIDGHGEYYLYFIEQFPEESEFEGDPISAFTVAELGEMLPDWFDSCKRDGSRNDWACRVFEKNNDKTHHSFAEKEANARAKMLIYLLENGLIKNEKI